MAHPEDDVDGELGEALAFADALDARAADTEAPAGVDPVALGRAVELGRRLASLPRHVPPPAVWSAIDRERSRQAAQAHRIRWGWLAAAVLAAIALGGSVWRAAGGAPPGGWPALAGVEALRDAPPPLREGDELAMMVESVHGH